MMQVTKKTHFYQHDKKESCQHLNPISSPYSTAFGITKESANRYQADARLTFNAMKAYFLKITSKMIPFSEPPMKLNKSANIHSH